MLKMGSHVHAMNMKYKNRLTALACSDCVLLLYIDYTHQRRKQNETPAPAPGSRSLLPPDALRRADPPVPRPPAASRPAVSLRNPRLTRTRGQAVKLR